MRVLRSLGGVGLVVLAGSAAADDPKRVAFQSTDLRKLEAVGEAQISPDATRIAYTVQRSDKPGKPSSEAWLWTVATGQSTRLGLAHVAPSRLRWSPDSRSLAALGNAEGAWGVVLLRTHGGPARLLAPVAVTNHPLPSTADPLCWSPDGQRIAFVSATPGPEAPSGDPTVITRYSYKPAASAATVPFNDNRRLHIFVVDVATRRVRQLTDGSAYEHSIACSPRGDEIAFLSNREADADRVFNDDIFAVRIADGQVRRLGATRSAEYAPAWSPDGRRLAFLGTKRPLTSSETTMEDDHAYVMDADGTGRKDVGGVIDNRQGPPQWSADGRSLYFTVQERGRASLYRLPVAGGAAERVAPTASERGSVGSWSLARNGDLAYALTTTVEPAALYLRTAEGERRLTSLNTALLAGRTLAAVEPFRFPSFDVTEIEAFLTRPAGPTTGGRIPLIVAIHGGPHSQQGPMFNPKAQVYAGQGWATLMVNYRGSIGYGQKLADAIFQDQNGGEAKDVLAGVDAALARYPWLDPERLGVEGGSYGGQLTNWLITQTDRFKAAIPSAGISNLVSFNYTAYYHDYLAVEFGAYPHEAGLMDLLWQRSPLRHVAKAKTPTLLLHGENDNDVPIAEAEQFFIALKDVGVETVLVRYPREGHGLRETAHIVDALDRSVEWYRRHFAIAP